MSVRAATGMAGLKSGVALAALFAAALGAWPEPAAGQAPRGASRGNDEAALAKVRNDIESLEKRLARQIDERDSGARALRAAELEVAAASRKLAATRAERRALESRRDELARDAAAAAARLGDERSALGEQLRLRYMSGRQEVVKLLLSQESPAALGRMLAYYDYFNAARRARIDTVGAQLGELAALERESERAATEVAAIEAEQARDVSALGAARDARKAALAKIEAGIADDERGLTRLRAEEEQLEELVAELRKILDALPIAADEPFGELKGKLAWPAAGRLVADYGQARPGGTPSMGLLIEADAGTPVRAVARGQVAFAQWLPQFGLLMMIDHGDGYLSLYAYNESLLKEEADWVEPGETIALVGDSGGQAEAGLYFEIRKGTQPVDPRPWVGRAPPSR